MRKVVDLCKQSKKAQKAFYAAQRGSWNGVNPVSRVVPNGKVYSRAKADARRDARRFFSIFALNSSCPGCIGYARRTIWGGKPKEVLNIWGVILSSDLAASIHESNLTAAWATQSLVMSWSGSL